MNKNTFNARHVIFLAVLAVILAWGLFRGQIVQRLNAEGTANQFWPHDVGQSAWFRTIESAITTNLLEADATAFLSETGIIQIGIDVTSGSATAGTITVYTQMAEADTVYSIIPTATFSLIASANKVSDIINIGPGYHKLVVSGAVGTFNFNLTVRDF